MCVSGLCCISTHGYIYFLLYDTSKNTHRDRSEPKLTLNNEHSKHSYIIKKLTKTRMAKIIRITLSLASSDVLVDM